MPNAQCPVHTAHCTLQCSAVDRAALLNPTATVAAAAAFRIFRVCVSMCILISIKDKLHKSWSDKRAM